MSGVVYSTVTTSSGASLELRMDTDARLRHLTPGIAEVRYLDRADSGLIVLDRPEVAARQPCQLRRRRRPPVRVRTRP